MNERELAFDKWWKLSTHNGTLPEHRQSLAREAYYAAWGGAALMGVQWQPTAEAVNVLPEPLRKYIAALETECDPAGTIRENFRLRDENAGLRKECAQLAALVAEKSQVK